LFDDFFFLFEDCATVWAFWVGFFHKAVTDFACKHFLIVFFCFCTYGRNFAIFHALENDFNGHIIAFERNFGLYCVFKRRT
tara:strand:- start:149 stop:391 length:243 start_codon:yes stop_codon:yes gene_type:complete